MEYVTAIFAGLLLAGYRLIFVFLPWGGLAFMVYILAKSTKSSAKGYKAGVVVACFIIAALAYGFGLEVRSLAESAFMILPEDDSVSAEALALAYASGIFFTSLYVGLLAASKGLEENPRLI